MDYYLWNIGCQMNAADARRIAGELEGLGLRAAAGPEHADLVVLNTCVVRQSAEDKVVGRLTSLRGLKRRRPDVGLAVMGCFVNDIPVLHGRYPWVDAFVKPSDIAGIISFAKKHLEDWSNGRLEGCVQPPNLPSSHPSSLPISAGVPINYGCDHLCTYCIVRLRRGTEISRPVPEIVAEVEDLVRRGAREVTLLGQNVDSYGHDLPEKPDLADLLQAVHGIDGLARIRFLTSHPADMTERLIEAAARLPKVCEHIEIPIQSGDDAVLRRMGRGHTVACYRELIGKIRAAMPGVGLATDVIAGFPGETEAQFEATYRLLEEVRFDVVHVAAYSARAGTPAEHLEDDVPPDEKERRRKAVDDLQERIVGEINAQYLGRAVEVLVEARHRGKWQGRTRTNKLVFFPVGVEDLAGRLVQVEITWTGPWSMQGEAAREAA